MTDEQQKITAEEFSNYWNGKGYEKGQSQPFWLALLREVYGVEKPEQYIEFEDQAHLDHTSFIDGYIPATRVMIEQKSRGKSLGEAIKQSDGSFLSPFQQAKRYITELPVSRHPRWVVTCNFDEFWIYDMEEPQGKPKKVLLVDLSKEYRRLQFLVDKNNEQVDPEKEISVAAGKLVGLLYDAFAKQYNDPESEKTMKSLNILCVRLVFCLYADDTGLFGKKGMFHDYMARQDVSHMRRALIELFKILDQPESKRDPYLEKESPTLAAFPYVNGGLFREEDIEIPPFNDEIRELLLSKAKETNESGEKFQWNWSNISPTIFGAVFESTLNPVTRRSGGMHYTSIENIHKAIDPLFLDDLRAKLDRIKLLKDKKDDIGKRKKERLLNFQDEISRLKFLDPACGSGNFLTETYISLRRLENEALVDLMHEQITYADIDIYNPIKVQISQFFGLEINDFAVAVARTALWIAESQMMKETESIVKTHLDFLPLTTNAGIHECNALVEDWAAVVKPDYIIGNPPFVGARFMDATQKKDVNKIFDGWRNAGDLDYVSCWYKKSIDLMLATDTKDKKTRAALVSTNSICQGESVGALWKPLFEQGAQIDFAHRTFNWSSEASDKAKVHCVIVGFSLKDKEEQNLEEKSNQKINWKTIYDGDSVIKARNINAYLIDADNIFVERRSRPLYDVPEIGIGNKPIDDGNYLFTEEERDAFIKKEPASEKYFRPWYGAQEFIKQKPRYCLWLGDCTPNEINRMPECKKRVQAVQDFRRDPKRSPETIKLGDTPRRFHVENMPTENYIVIPKVTTSRRDYIPIGMLTPDAMCSDLVFLMPGATLYHFGVLTSSVHMAWMRTVCGRLRVGYRYSAGIVFNNFPWPDIESGQEAKIKTTAQAILDVRAKYPDSSLKDLYDDASMPAELLKAHRDNDRAVRSAYKFSSKMKEPDIVAALMDLYQARVDSLQKKK